MRLLAIFVLLLALTLGFAHKSVAYSEKYFHIYAAAGLNLSPGSLRIGHKSWELGMLNYKAYGVNKIFRQPSGVYAGFGLALIAAPQMGYGFYGSVGYDWDIIWGFSLRGELNGVASVVGQTYGGMLVGLNFAY